KEALDGAEEGFGHAEQRSPGGDQQRADILLAVEHKQQRSGKRDSNDVDREGGECEITGRGGSQCGQARLVAAVLRENAGSSSGSEDGGEDQKALSEVESDRVEGD